VALEVKLPVPYGADNTMRIIIAFASVLLSGAALAGRADPDPDGKDAVLARDVGA